MFMGGRSLPAAGASGDSVLHQRRMRGIPANGERSRLLEYGYPRVAKWFKATVCKTVYRRFESRPWDHFASAFTPSQVHPHA